MVPEASLHCWTEFVRDGSCHQPSNEITDDDATDPSNVLLQSGHPHHADRLQNFVRNLGSCKTFTAELLCIGRRVQQRAEVFCA